MVIEHNLDVIKTADWVIDLGPGGRVNGARIAVTGTPEEVAACDASFTGQYLRPLLERASTKPVSSPAQAGAQPRKSRRKASASDEDIPDLIAAK